MWLPSVKNQKWSTYLAMASWFPRPLIRYHFKGGVDLYLIIAWSILSCFFMLKVISYTSTQISVRKKLLQSWYHYLTVLKTPWPYFAHTYPVFPHIFVAFEEWVLFCLRALSRCLSLCWWGRWVGLVIDNHARCVVLCHKMGRIYPLSCSLKL